MTRDIVTDAAVVAGIGTFGFLLSDLNELLAMIGFILAIPVAFLRIYIGYNQAKKWWKK